MILKNAKQPISRRRMNDPEIVSPRRLLAQPFDRTKGCIEKRNAVRRTARAAAFAPRRPAVVRECSHASLRRPRPEYLKNIRSLLRVLTRARIAVRELENQGTGSYPLPPHGWQRDRRLSVSHPPFRGPYLRNASTAYAEHVGVKRHDGGVKGDMQYW